MSNTSSLASKFNNPNPSPSTSSPPSSANNPTSPTNRVNVKLSERISAFQQAANLSPSASFSSSKTQSSNDSGNHLYNFSPSAASSSSSSSLASSSSFSNRFPLSSSSSSVSHPTGTQSLVNSRSFGSVIVGNNNNNNIGIPSPRNNNNLNDSPSPSPSDNVSTSSTSSPSSAPTPTSSSPASSRPSSFVVKPSTSKPGPLILPKISMKLTPTPSPPSSSTSSPITPIVNNGSNANINSNNSNMSNGTSTAMSNGNVNSEVSVGGRMSPIPGPPPPEDLPSPKKDNSANVNVTPPTISTSATSSPSPSPSPSPTQTQTQIQTPLTSSPPLPVPVSSSPPPSSSLSPSTSPRHTNRPSHLAITTTLLTRVAAANALPVDIDDNNGDSPPFSPPSRHNTNAPPPSSLLSTSSSPSHHANTPSVSSIPKPVSSSSSNYSSTNQHDGDDDPEISLLPSPPPTPLQIPKPTQSSNESTATSASTSSSSSSQALLSTSPPLSPTAADAEDDASADVSNISSPPLPIISSTSDFSLSHCLHSIINDNDTLNSELLSLEGKTSDLRALISGSSRKNFILERELNDIDGKIKLLIKNKIQISEVVANSSFLRGYSGKDKDKEKDKEGSEHDPLRGKKILYEEFFYLLQSRPRYFADLALLLSPTDIPLFIQTVVFDTYGDQYDSREERLLLTMFRRLIRLEIDKCTDRGSLFRANTATTQMLSAYAKRGQGLGILKEILEIPLKELFAQKELNLEIIPSKVYLQYVSEWETENGKTLVGWEKEVTDDEAMKKSEISKIVNDRVKQLTSICTNIFQRMVTNVEIIPYGMRWICKIMYQLYKKKFPAADRYQRGSVVGGYIYLRFFNPVIVTPDGVNFIQQKPSKNMRRNLILIAKVLQNLSNGLLFGEKEAYMKYMNPFISGHLERIQQYFDDIINVDDIETELQFDRYLEHTEINLNCINISVNQILQIHSLCMKHAKKLMTIPLATAAATSTTTATSSSSTSTSTSSTASSSSSSLSPAVPVPSSSPSSLPNKYDIQLKSVLDRLGPPLCEEVKSEDNRTIPLKLIDHRDIRMSTTAMGGMPSSIGRSVVGGIGGEGMGGRGGGGMGRSMIGGMGMDSMSGVLMVDPNGDNDDNEMNLLTHPLNLQAKSQLLSTLRKLPIFHQRDVQSFVTQNIQSDKLYQNSLYSFLDYQKKYFTQMNESQQADGINNCMSMLNTLITMKLIPNFTNSSSSSSSSELKDDHSSPSSSSSSSPSFPSTSSVSLSSDDYYNLFLSYCSLDSTHKIKQVKKLQKSLTLASSTLNSINSHHNYLQSRLDLYKIYLENARVGQSMGSGSGAVGGKTEGKEKDNHKDKDKDKHHGKDKDHDKENKENNKIVKFTHSQLVDMGVVTYVQPEVQSSILKSCFYTFQQTSNGIFKVDLILKKGPIEMSLLARQLDFVLEEILKRQEEGRLEMDVEVIKLNVNLLIHLLNTNFMKKEKK